MRGRYWRTASQEGAGRHCRLRDGGEGEASRSWKLELDYRLFGIYLGAWTWPGPSRASQPPWAGTTSEPGLVGLLQRGYWECGHVSAENIC